MGRSFPAPRPAVCRFLSAPWWGVDCESAVDRGLASAQCDLPQDVAEHPVALLTDVIGPLPLDALDRRGRDALLRVGVDAALEGAALGVERVVPLLGVGGVAQRLVRAPLEVAEAMLARARRKTGARKDALEWVEGDMLALPFADAAATRPDA